MTDEQTMYLPDREEAKMSGPIVFISTHRIKEGKLEEFKELSRKVVPSMEAGKPGTLVYEFYLNEGGTELTIVHVFPDADAMDLHVQGVDERAADAFEFIEPQHFEIYGAASEQVMAMMSGYAGRGIGLTVKPENMAGFIRLQSVR